MVGTVLLIGKNAVFQVIHLGEVKTVLVTENRPYRLKLTRAAHHGGMRLVDILESWQVLAGCSSHPFDSHLRQPLNKSVMVGL